jgi:hypothetical protein
VNGFETTKAALTVRVWGNRALLRMGRQPDELEPEGAASLEGGAPVDILVGAIRQAPLP